MQIGYVLCTPDRSKILCVEKKGTGIEMVETKEKINLDRALCLNNLTAIKNIYRQFQDKALVDTLDIVDIQELYR